MGDSRFKVKNGLLVETGSSEITGSLSAPNITGSLFGTASWANRAVTASYVSTAETASYVLQAVSASFATSASQALTASVASTVVYNTGIVLDNEYKLAVGPITPANSSVSLYSGLSFNPVLNRLLVSSSVSASSFTGSLLGTASFATSASYAFNATSASFATSASRAVTASFIATASWANNAVTASLALSITSSNISGDITLGTQTSGSYVATISSGNGLSGQGVGEGSTPTLSLNTSSAHFISGAREATAGNYVTLTDAQSISGEKTFNAVIKGDLGLDTLDGQGITWRAAAYGTANARINFTNGSGMAFYSDGTVTPTIFLSDDTNRRLGIGKTTPNAKLDVNGDTIISGSTTITGSTYLTGLTSATRPSAVFFDSSTGQLFYSNTSSIAGGGGTISGSGANGYIARFSGSSAISSSVMFESAGNIGIGTTSPGATLDVNGNTYSRSNLSIGQGGSASEYYLDIGTGRTGNGFAYIDLVGDATYTDYGFRIIRGNTGANSNSDLVHRGTGDIRFVAEEAANMRFSTTNSERLTILAGGDVGIGTTSPSTKLEVVGNAVKISGADSSGGILNVYNGQLGFTAIQNLLVSESYVDVYRLRVRGSSGGNFNSIVYASIDNAGNGYFSGSVGIGTTSPLTKLDVRSGVITAGSNASTEGTEIIRGYYTAGALAVIGSERSNGGPVIGYAVKPSTSAADAFLSATSINVPRGAYTIAGAEHKWYTGSAQTVAENSAVTMGRAMTLDANGNLGIGTTTPYDKLEVNGAIAATGATTGNNSQGHATIIQVNGSTSYLTAVDWGAEYKPLSVEGKTLDLRTGTGTTTSRLYIDNTGSVGIGTTSPGNKLTVSGSIESLTDNTGGSSEGGQLILRAPSGGVYRYNIDNYQNNLRIFREDDATAASGVVHLFVSSSGNFGVGTSTPAYKLEVSGDAKITAGALGVNVNPNATDGRIDASNDVVAYSSDRRLKTNVDFLENSLEKVGKLQGFTYNWNELAKEKAGFDTESRLVGLFAQDVQEVLPEAVKLAPFDNNGKDESISGENYLTVQYEKLVPLLVEAIKEQQKQINELKQTIETLKNK